MTQCLSVISRTAVGAATLLGLCAPTHAAVIDVTVTVQNMAPVDSISFAPLHVGFNNGSFDAFNLGGVATTPIISVAEGGAGGAWQAAFAAADPTATRGTIGGLLLPGATSSLTFRVDTTLNPFFTFGSMVVPSNDFFIGNDSPTEYRLFDAGGNLNLSTIGIKANEIWDAGSEVFDPAAAAFVGSNDLRRDQNSVVAFNFAEFAAFNGLTTGAGYSFNSALTADSDVYRITFGVSAVPEPGSYALMAAGLMAVGFVARRRRVGTQQLGTAAA
ncbi:spondin domain-containing protein [Paucibacter sp. XJ19-41]|uniref:spondin domain-containing protein n=1 Tax=Paucibacter sp. XJ19-41 TaxID=2927824 RepID=UPI00234B32F9|nr:spondin domain-containing protein [Paucibacter sp. XJ19-41]MDC6167789.1 spondin domain-containing protein [Paucibacter sp. XJ19-41]